MKNFFLQHKKLHLWLLADLVLLALFALLRESRAVMNGFVGHFSTPIRRLVGRLCYRVDFSVAELLCILLVLAVIAYNQPVTRAYVDQVRGVDSSYTVSMLQDRGLIEECGRLEVPGRPAVFRTTDVFLRTMGISSMTELPPLPEVSAGEGMDKLKEAIDKLQAAENGEQLSIDDVSGEASEE